MSQSSVLFANTYFHKTDLLLKCLDWRPAYTGQRIKQDMGNICPISDVLVLSFAIIKDWIGCTAVSSFLKPEIEREETEIKIHKRKRGKEKGLLQPSGSPSSKVKGQRAVHLAEGQAEGWDVGPAPRGLRCWAPSVPLCCAMLGGSFAIMLETGAPAGPGPHLSIFLGTAPVCISEDLTHLWQM